jgi:hypothetical protein
MHARLPVLVPLAAGLFMVACQPATQPASTPGAPTPLGKASPAVSASPSPAPKPAISSPAPAASPSPAAAPKPTDASLRITAPAEGASTTAGPVTVTVEYTGPALVPAAEAKKLDDYHLHYFLDEDATAYIGTTTPIPTGNPKVIHSGSQEVTFQDVAAGEHTVTVVMTGSNHISVNPPVSDQVKVTVR